MEEWKEPQNESQETWFQMPSLPLTNCLTMAKSVKFFEPQFPSLLNREYLYLILSF